MEQLKVLAFFDFFHPAFKSGGPAKSSLGFLESLGHKMSIGIVSRDRDVGDEETFVGRTANEWQAFKSHGRIYYSHPDGRGSNLTKAVRTFGEVDVYYLNSFFSV